MVEKSGFEEFMVEKSGVEETGVDKLMVEKSGFEESGVAAWGWAVDIWTPEFSTPDLYLKYPSLKSL